MEIPAGYRHQRDGAFEAVVRDDLAELPPATWWGATEPLPGVRGRGGIGALAVPERPELQLVVRPYRRGGLLRSVLPDRFRGGLDRAWRELDATLRLRSAGIECVEPVVATARRRPWGAELRLVTVRWDATETVMHRLDAQPGERRGLIRLLGRLLARAFDAGLRHPDLHADNVLVADRADGPTLAFVDLDRAEVRLPLGDDERHSMLLRLARYPLRHADRLNYRLRTVDAWRLLDGLGWTRERRRAEWPQLLAEFDAMLRRHRLHRSSTRRS